MRKLGSEELRIVIRTVVVGVVISLYGIFGYMIVEDWDFMDALYQTVMTVSTVGFMEVHPMSQSGRLVTIFLIVFAITLFGYFFSKFVTIVVEGRLRVILRGRKMEKNIGKLRDHFIICGYGRMGRQIALEFKQAEVPFVVLDRDAAVFEREYVSDLLWITGDASTEEDLDMCGIMRARGLVSVLREDEDNIYAILTARGMNPNLRIVTRANKYESERKLKRAGADHVISPFRIGGSRIASIMLRPSISHFLDGLARAEEIRLTLIEIEVKEGSRLFNMSIKDTGVTDIPETILVGLRRPRESMHIRPPLDTILRAGDQLVVMGRLDAIKKVEELQR